MRERFESKDVIADAVDALYALCEELDRGDTLLNDQIGAATGCAPHCGHWPQTVKRLRARILEVRGITLWPEPGVGLRFLTVQETLVDVPRARKRRASRQVRRGARSLAALPSDELTLHQRHIRSAQLESMTQARRDIDASLRVSAAIASPTATLPQRKRPAVVSQSGPSVPAIQGGV